MDYKNCYIDIYGVLASHHPDYVRVYAHVNGVGVLLVVPKSSTISHILDALVAETTK